MCTSQHETRLLVAFECEWSRPNLLRGLIDKSAHDGNAMFWREVELHLLEVIEVERSQESLKLPKDVAAAGAPDAATSQTQAKAYKGRLPSVHAFINSGIRVQWWLYVVGAVALLAIIGNAVFLSRLLRFENRLSPNRVKGAEMVTDLS